MDVSEDQFEEQLANAKLPERIVRVCLRGDLVADLEEIDRQFAELPENGPDTRLTSGAARRRLAEQAEALRQEMEAARVPFRLRALPRRKWDALLKLHPPVEGDKDDEEAGFNQDTFWDALLPLSIVEPASTAKRWDQLVDLIAAPDWIRLAAAARDLNRRKVDVPFSHAASLLTENSDSE